MRGIVLIGFMFATVAGSFFTTLRLTSTPRTDPPSDNRSAADKLGDYRIFDRGDLTEAAVGIGMHRSLDMRGVVDEVIRINSSEVNIRGWLADLTGEAKSLDVVVFAAGRKAAMTRTQGERPDVAKTLKLVSGAEKNLAFQLTFNCRTGDDLVTVGLGRDKQYFWLSSGRCP